MMQPQTAAKAATTEARVRRLLVEALQLAGLDPASIPENQPLFGAGLGLDSVDALELVVALEREFGITVPSEDVGREAFTNLRTLTAFVEGRRALIESRGGRIA
jgi:acyl carrier protein